MHCIPHTYCPFLSALLNPTLPAPSPHLRLPQLLCGLGEVKDVIYDLQRDGGEGGQYQGLGFGAGQGDHQAAKGDHEAERGGGPNHTVCVCGGMRAGRSPDPSHLEGQSEVLAILVHGGLDRLRGITEGGGAARG